MIDLKELQKKVYANKLRNNWNVTDIAMEFCLTYEELSEAYKAYYTNKEDLGEELADVVIYLLGLSEILGIDLEKEILSKVEKNSKRTYKKVDGEIIKIEGGIESTE